MRKLCLVSMPLWVLSGCCEMAYGPSQCRLRDAEQLRARSYGVTKQTAAPVQDVSADEMEPVIVPAPPRPVVQAPFMRSPSLPAEQGGANAEEAPAQKEWLRLP